MYRLDAPASAIAAALGADAGQDPWLGGGIAPGDYAPVVIGSESGRRRLVPRQWGVPPPPRGERVVTHVRNLASPFWIGTLRHTQFRVLVPATRVQAAQGGWFSLPSCPVFALAGIWRDSEVPSFAILTAQGEADTRAMPVILHPRDHGAWLGAAWAQAQGLVRPWPSAALLHHAADAV